MNLSKMNTTFLQGVLSQRKATIAAIEGLQPGDSILSDKDKEGMLKKARAEVADVEAELDRRRQ
jgi:hypothetical protein